MAKMLFDHCEDLVSRNLQSIVKKFDCSAADDEKLFMFTVDDGDLCLVISKPDRI